MEINKIELEISFTSNASGETFIFHMDGFVLGLSLIEKPEATKKWLLLETECLEDSKQLDIFLGLS